MNPSGIGLALLVATGGHLMNAGAALADKFLLKRAFVSPLAYAAWIGLMSLLVFVLLPFDLHYPTTLQQWLVDLLGGATFSLALIAYLSAVSQAEISSVVPIIGAISPIITLGLSYLVLGEVLAPHQYLAIGILVIGFLILTVERSAVPRRAIPLAILAALLFATSSVMMKVAFAGQPFISALAFSRLGGLIVALGTIFVPGTWQALRETGPRLDRKNLLVIALDHTAGAAGFVLLNYAIALSSPTIINALQGIQYGFLFLLTLIAARLSPAVYEERASIELVVRKLLGIVVVALGLGYLAAR